MFVKCFLLSYNIFGDYMYIIKNDKIFSVKYCSNFINKSWGFMFQKRKNYALYFKNCTSIHTFFCFFPIDVYLLDEHNKILYSYYNLGKNKIIWPKKHVKHILEVPSGLVKEFTLKDDN